MLRAPRSFQLNSSSVHAFAAAMLKSLAFCDMMECEAPPTVWGFLVGCCPSILRSITSTCLFAPSSTVFAHEDPKVVESRNISEVRDMCFRLDSVGVGHAFEFYTIFPTIAIHLAAFPVCILVLLPSSTMGYCRIVCTRLRMLYHQQQ